MTMFKKMKLFPKTFFYMVFLFGIIIGITHISIYFLLPQIYLKTINENFEQKLDELEDTISAVNWCDCGSILEQYAQRNHMNLIAEGDGEKKNFEGAGFHMVTESGGQQQVFLDEGDSIESITMETREATSRDGVKVALEASISTQPVREAIDFIKLLLPITFGVAVLISVLFAYLYSKKITKPIEEMLRVTTRMENLERDAYFHNENRDEIGILAGQINQVYGRLWQTIDSLEKEKQHISEMEKAKVDFLRSASHELKTPLAGLRILLENMQLNVGRYKDHTTYLGSGIETVDQLTEMLQEILDSSRIQGEIGRTEKSLLSVKEEIEAVWKDYEVLAKSKGLDVALELDPEAQVELNQKYFRRAWSNLISNAVRYAPEGGRIHIEGKKDEISIWNSCTPLAEEQLSHIFEAFYRPDFARDAYSGGNGLGLYIVKEILDANGLPFSFRPEGEGMIFRMGLGGRSEAEGSRYHG